MDLIYVFFQLDFYKSFDVMARSDLSFLSYKAVFLVAITSVHKVGELSTLSYDPDRHCPLALIQQTL